ncbi:DUF805 domain-containing protein [Lactococcus garvieae]|uniref:DUF805 domain-containing protein n=1 Tax=Lactococcus garvieae TaxID=1363 RepID=UPI0038520318
MMKAYVKYWKGYVIWDDKMSRKEWWWITLCNFIAVFFIFLPLIFDIIFVGTTIQYGDFLVNPFIDLNTVSMIQILFSLYFTATFVPSVSLTFSRLRDAGLPLGLFFCILIPFIGGVIIFILMQMPSKNIYKKKNK